MSDRTYEELLKWKNKKCTSQVSINAGGKGHFDGPEVLFFDADETDGNKVSQQQSVCDSLMKLDYKD